MKETLIDLKERRSCRKYLPQQIKEEELNAILEAGTYAPTGMGAQSPVIVVVQKPELIEKISKMNAKVMGQDIDPFYGAPTVLIVLADTQRPTYLYDGALVMGNLMNAAQAVGVDSCYIFRAKEVFASEEGKALLKEWGIPEHYEGIGNCILGYRAEGGVKEAAPRKVDYIIRA
ncbi:MAG TPA: nitroreductase [Candidatus Eubacterium avistercoris]|uniref:Nitroreductase n=1 Tax=Candidatus Eubacterium avistercoris TaxID=2838567 RepID=A0A9D2D4D8_9FIRM|nr:nitroreductase [Candidatus Eubacterium avistercoris]